MSMLPFGHCQGQKLCFFTVSGVPKLRPAGHPNLPRPVATSQAALVVADTVFLESFYTATCASTAALPSAAAAFGCARCMHSLGLSPPCHTCRCSICGHLPSLALLLLLILGSPPNNQDTLWQRSLPCPHPPLGARAAQLPHPRPAWLPCPRP